MPSQSDMFPADEPPIDELVARGALFVINHSGGKDSQIMTLLLAARIPRSQLLVVHAPLKEVEWADAIDHIEATIPDVPFILAPIASGKTLLERVEERGKFPGPGRRWCTSDFKRGPIEREIRRYLKAHPAFGGLIVSCMGMRAQESARRAKQVTWEYDAGNSLAGREWYNWLPIHGLLEDEVFAGIRAAGQEPHWSYGAGMSRFSCVFCIYGSDSDLTIGAHLNPALYQKYATLEVRTGHTLSPSLRTLPEITRIAIGEDHTGASPVPVAA